jgi:hypothetical protein
MKACVGGLVLSLRESRGQTGPQMGRRDQGAPPDLIEEQVRGSRCPETRLELAQERLPEQ